MTERRTSTGDGPEAARYEIRVVGALGANWATRFEGLTLSVEDDGTTIIAGPSPTRRRFTACSSGSATSAPR